MPAPTARNAPDYTERLSVPGYWWLLGAAGTVFAAAELFAGLPLLAALIGSAAVAVVVVLGLVAVGRTTVRVDHEGLHAGGRTLPHARIADAVPLDRQATRERLGPAADPAAHVVLRAYVGGSVLVRPTEPAAVSYWLVSTRRPGALAAALTR